jgi:Ca2+-binding RTX toxin-like protein
MLTLDLPTTPYWLALPRGVRVEIRPVTTAVMAAAQVDTFQGYSVADDTILLDDAIFTALGSPGTLAAGAFKDGTAATDADDRIIYNSGTGALLYDADGVGGAAAVQFATLTGVSGIINNAEFVII